MSDANVDHIVEVITRRVEAELGRRMQAGVRPPMARWRRAPMPEAAGSPRE